MSSEVVVTVSPVGAIAWNGEAVSLEELEKRVADAARLDPKPDISVRVSPDADQAESSPQDTRILFRVVDLITRSGMGKAGIILSPPS